MRTIAVINQKGGCGKTTVSINLAAALAEQGQRTLLVDMDPQGHCGLGLAVPHAQLETTIADALLAGRPETFDFSDVLWQISSRLDLAPAGVSLAAVEMRLAHAPDRDLRLANALAPLRPDYDFCIIDCPPSIGLLTFNALRAAPEVIIPVDTGYFALNGSMRQVETLQAMTRRCGHGAAFYVLANMLQPAEQLSWQIYQEMRSHFGERVLPQAIAMNPRLREAASFGQPIGEYDAGGKAAADFEALAGHFVTLVPPHAAHVSEGAPRPADLPGGGGGAALAVEAATDAARNAAEPSHARRAVDADPRPRDTPQPDARPTASHEARPTASHEARPAVPPARRGNSRMEDLMRRARALADRTTAMQESLARDPDVARLATHRPPDPAPPAATHTAATATATSVAPPLPALAQKLERFFGARVTAQGALFVQPGDEAEQVAVAGDFNGWSPRATPMRFNERLNVWEACIDLPPGRYRYRLIADGQWRHDRYNQHVQQNTFGELDSILEVR